MPLSDFDSRQPPSNGGHFKGRHFVQEESSGQSKAPRIIKVEPDLKPQVSVFELPSVREPGTHEYSSTKKKFGALAATDPDRHSKSRKDARFQVNPLLRDPLSIEEEERRSIEERVAQLLGDRASAVEAEAKEAGYRAGLEAGHAEAFSRTQAAGEDLLRRLESMISTCEAMKAQIYEANERLLVELVFQLSRRILLRELNQDRDYVKRLARALMEKLGVRDHVKIQVNEKDFGAAAGLRQGLEAVFGALNNLRIEPSSQVVEGGCILETEWNSLDAAVETQFEGLHAALVGDGPAFLKADDVVAGEAPQSKGGTHE